jgi:catechol 2,3-dioxygenase-like lactoylglutathione lyase family enzyme
MSFNPRFGHVNLIARDWRRVAAFFTDVFGCTLVPPERDFKSAELDAGTALRDAHLTGCHLRLPGFGDDGPTLEIFSYDVMEPAGAVAVNRLGFGHIAFQVDSVSEARAAVLAAGGKAVGEIVTLRTSDGRFVTWCYVTDVESNVIELQSWSAE